MSLGRCNHLSFERKFTRVDCALIALLLLLAFVLLSKGISVGGLRFGDSAAHAMDGVLIHDWIASGPDAWFHPMTFATEQYAHYPTLGIGRHYPPGFALVEALFLAVFGVSPFSSRLCVVFFGLVAVFGVYVFVRRFAGRLPGVLSVIALVTMPMTLRWGRQVMLEMPTMAILIWTAVAFARYIEQPTGKRLCYVLLLGGLAVLFKQPAVFILGAVTLTLVVGSVLGSIKPAHAVWAASVSIMALLIVVVSLDGHGAKLLSGDASFDTRWSWAAVSYYATHAPQQVGVGLLIAAGVGALCIRRMPLMNWAFLLAWLGVYYALLVVADFKNTRFFFFALFPLAVWAGMGAAWVLSFLPHRQVRIASCVLVSAVCCAVAWNAPIDYRPDFGSVVQSNEKRISGHAVLFSGLREGDFVFAVRQHLPWRSAIIIRSSKLLYTCNGRIELDFNSRVSSIEELEEVMRDLAFETLFVERANKLKLTEEELLRDYLADSPAYERTESYTFRTGDVPNYRDTTLDVYEAVEPLIRSVDSLDILIPRTNRTVHVQLPERS